MQTSLLLLLSLRKSTLLVAVIVVALQTITVVVAQAEVSDEVTAYVGASVELKCNLENDTHIHWHKRDEVSCLFLFVFFFF